MRHVVRFRSLPLRSRLAILTAVAVAAAVTASALLCWFFVRGTLMNSLDNSLRDNRMPPQRVVDQLRAGRCTTEPPASADQAPNPFNSTVQVVSRTGASCVIQGSQSLHVTGADTDVAKGTLREALHTVTGSDGNQYRAVTLPLLNTDGAYTVARPLSEVNESLNTLGLVLLAVGGLGVIGASVAGLAVARAGLKPVDRLTRTVEHIARTEDLSVRIPVHGDDEIARLSASFNAMTAALSSSQELQQQLIADAGHELRTPLTSLRTNIELLERSEMTGRALPPQDRRELLSSVKAQMGELAALIGDLQELSRPQAVQGGGPLQTVAFHEEVEAALERARLRTGPDLKITAELAPWYVRAEPGALERAVINLLDNAVKFSPPAGTVEVALHGGELTVRDHGPGVPPEDLPHVFERFWRSTSARSLPGSGLGLSIVARTVEQSDGTVRLRSASGGGTTAVVYLPGGPIPPADDGT
ncbi:MULTISPECIES: sensor histidine kinase [unclassified Streptomyces]|uniref:sensor histidine kinase n=1 Tax=unclassified Streptomyces TaxID=2593676 RepID=UPI00380CBA06